MILNATEKRLSQGLITSLSSFIQDEFPMYPWCGARILRFPTFRRSFLLIQVHRVRSAKGRIKCGRIGVSFQQPKFKYIQIIKTFIVYQFDAKILAKTIHINQKCGGGGQRGWQLINLIQANEKHNNFSQTLLFLEYVYTLDVLIHHFPMTVLNSPKLWDNY